MTRPDQPPAVEVAPGIFQVGLPLPFALNRVNAYLLHDQAHDTWTVVDTGLHTEAGQLMWERAFDLLAIPPARVTAIVLTHMHPDHYGMAGWLQAWCAHGDECPPVYMSPVELAAARRVWIERGDRADEMRAHMRRGGLPEAAMPDVIRIGEETAQQTAPHPTVFHELHAGDTFGMGGRNFQIMQYGGHSDGHLLFYDAASRLMLCGDHVLNKITPNIGLWHDTSVQPLPSFIASLIRLKMLPVDLALPGHKTLITDWAGRIDELAGHHAARLTLATDHAAVAGGATAYEIGSALFPAMDRFSPHEMRFAIAEALAHLEYLYQRGEIGREGDSVWRYTA